MVVVMFVHAATGEQSAAAARAHFMFAAGMVIPADPDVAVGTAQPFQDVGRDERDRSGRPSIRVVDEAVVFAGDDMVHRYIAETEYAHA